MTALAVGRSNFGRLGIGCEAIAFQHDVFGSQLEAIFNDMEKFLNGEFTADREYQERRREEEYEGVFEDDSEMIYLRIKLARSHFGDLLSDLIYKRLGIKTSFRFNNDCLGAVMPFFINKHHIFLDEFFRGQNLGLRDQEKLLKEFNNKSGWVDLHAAKVGGIFSEYTHIVYLDVVGHIKRVNSTIPEIVAILLHELGHAFTFYEFADRVQTSNQVLAHLSQEIRKPTAPGRRIYLFKELAESFGVKDEEFHDMIEENNHVILGLKLFKKYIGFVSSQLPNAKYDETSSEQVADNFATRFGYGRPLITALDKLYQGSPERSASLRRWMPYLEIIFAVIMPIAFIFALFVTGAVIPGVLISAIFFIVFFSSGDADRDMTYDVLKMRYTRVRHQYIEMLNTVPMAKEELRKVINDVHRLDEIIKDTAIYRTLYNRVMNFLSFRNRAARDDIELQYLLEELAHNNLFLKSAELKAL